MHQKIPLDFERGERGERGRRIKWWYVRTRLIASLLGCLHQWKGGGEGAFEFERNFKRYR